MYWLMASGPDIICQRALQGADDYCVLCVHGWILRVLNLGLFQDCVHNWNLSACLYFFLGHRFLHIIKLQ